MSDSNGIVIHSAMSHFSKLWNPSEESCCFQRVDSKHANLAKVKKNAYFNQTFNQTRQTPLTFCILWLNKWLKNNNKKTFVISSVLECWRSSSQFCVWAWFCLKWSARWFGWNLWPSGPPHIATQMWSSWQSTLFYRIGVVSPTIVRI